MTQISISSTLGLGLHQAREPVEVTDEFGHVIGQFIPATRSLMKPEDGYPRSEGELREKLENALANPWEGKPLAEFWKEMELPK